ncbi:unnamed protein product [Pleuronectes platessa]|uniref:Uncharacterized protein n=1 Tax=Pleuronectes platessa TaxID=8262 RepID=A0A9N7VMG6_PLEPL|nr:unnamed protein product [Pleuronectes platessa]
MEVTDCDGSGQDLWDTFLPTAAAAHCVSRELSEKVCGISTGAQMPKSTGKKHKQAAPRTESETNDFRTPPSCAAMIIRAGGSSVTLSCASAACTVGIHRVRGREMRALKWGM